MAENRRITTRQISFGLQLVLTVIFLARGIAQPRIGAHLNIQPAVCLANMAGGYVWDNFDTYRLNRADLEDFLKGLFGSLDFHVSVSGASDSTVICN